MGSHFAGLNAIVTGGASGVGRAIVLALAAEGCHVTATGLSATEIAEFAASLTSSQGALVSVVVLDVVDDTAIAALVQRQERLDILVNCAGTILRDEAEFQVEQFEQVIDVNLTGTMRMCVASRPLLQQRGGSIVNMASMLSFFGSGSVPAYSASKGAIVQLTRSLAIAWAAAGIRVNAVAPGWIVTSMTRRLVEDDARSRAILARTPLGRWGQPEEIAGAVLFLCSPAARFITGAILPVDGGYSAM